MKQPGTCLCAAVALWLVLAAAAAAQFEGEADPLGGILGDMQAAGGRLGKMLTDNPTQQKEKDAIDKLDNLIKLLEERRRQCQGSQSGANPSEPLQDSVIKTGPGGSGPLHDANRKGRSWGQLPPHKREQILQSMTEGFPAHYQQLLERYYLRLAEEKPAGDGEASDAGAKAAEPPAPANAPKDAISRERKPNLEAARP
jgi:hypothetical protein